MKRKILSAAISAASLAGFSHTASAATAYDVYVAGSSAQDALILAEVYTHICGSAGFNYYADADTGGNNYKAYTCTVVGNASNGLTAQNGDFVTFHKVNFGGSAQGILPFLQGSAATGSVQVNVMTTNHCTAASSNAKMPNGTAVPSYNCATTNAGDLIPESLDAGVADVNPLMFRGPSTAFQVYNTATGQDVFFPPVTPAMVGAATWVTIVPATSLIWSVPVTLNLYSALQAAQGLLNYGGTYGHGQCTAGQYSLDPVNAKDGDCMPSLTRSQIATILSGGMTDWSEMYLPGSNGSLVNVYAAAQDLAAHTSYALPDDTFMNICMRTPGSGTAASQYAYFLNAPGNSATFQAPTNNSVVNVYSIADGGNLEKCLDDLSVGGNTTVDYHNNTMLSLEIANGSTSGTTPYQGWAIGQQSSDKNATKSKHYRFVKINGVAPNLVNTFNSTYDFTSESTWIYPINPGSRASEQAIARAMIKFAQNPTAMGTDYDQYVSQDFGTGGFLATIQNAIAQIPGYTVPTTGVNLLSPVNPWTHAVGTTLDDDASQTLGPNNNGQVMP